MPLFASTQSLEAYLGDPKRDESFLSYAKSIVYDEREEVPQESIDALNQWGLAKHFVPKAYGGVLQDLEQLTELIRTVSRRDLSTAIARFKTMLGSLPVWIASSTDQATHVAKGLIEDDDMSFALTEREHGSDLLANETTHQFRESDIELSGEKWLINNANRSRFLAVLSRENGKSGPLSLSLILIDKHEMDLSTVQHLAKIHTLGVRGADISGIRFNASSVQQDRVIGRPGHGLDCAMRTFQISRAACAGLSLGAADSAIRICLDFVKERRLYDKTVWEIDTAAQTLANCFRDLQICEALSAVVLRGIHYHPELMCLWSSISKYLVPTLVEGILQDTSTILGARHYLRSTFAHGVFQKIIRDHALVPVFDGSTQVNLYAIASQMPQSLEQSVERSLAKELTTSALTSPEIDFKALRFRMTAPDPMLADLWHDTKWNSWLKQIDRISRDHNDPSSFARFHAAKIYSLLFAAGCCRLIFPDDPFALEDRILFHLEGFSSQVKNLTNANALRELEKRYHEKTSFGL